MEERVPSMVIRIFPFTRLVAKCFNQASLPYRSYLSVAETSYGTSAFIPVSSKHMALENETPASSTGSACWWQHSRLCQLDQMLEHYQFKVPAPLEPWLLHGQQGRPHTFADGRDESNKCLPDIITYNTLIDGLCKTGRVPEANRLFGDMKAKFCNLDVIMYSCLIGGFCKLERIDMACMLFDDTLKQAILPDVVTFSTLVEGYCNAGLVDDAERLLEEMVASDCSPDVYTYTSLVDGFCKVGRMVEACRSWEADGGLQAAGGDGWQRPNVITYRSLIGGFCGTGDLEEARKMLERLERDENCKADMFAYRVMMDGLCTTGRMSAALELLEAIRQSGTPPRHDIYVALIRGLCQGKELGKALEVLEEMTLSRKSRPNAEA
ncbi:pentatricopeptide repeat-containing protein At1g05670, mitochondrial [Selaginella moellendorffii]|uniref:pentatricopeptide repeat-containing protein At1g05670, mitochondrial n=1 Tax=Selaginella moellendorffii TaxID=88036 RepID=UPI000D1C6238|nr:pentatricopeptide repeat-containing protein At1g05670, mitochondrial [Selaginella moellendorffii]|eukprot:XP_024532526.1 pentatricopeptide repeat-containing protein At1g05670, mitochondrial [Selaginella moellendorffii]